MIIDAWMCRYKNNKIEYYEIVDVDEVLKKGKTGYKVRYSCDCKTCRHPNKIHTTTSSTLLRGGWNNIKTQMCRSCRSVKSERIKGVTLPFDTIKMSIESEGYTMLSSPESYENVKQPSQYKLKVKCNKGHEYYITWNNWSKGKRCRKCYEEDKYNNSVKYLRGFDLYKYMVLSETNSNYKQYKHLINPYNIKRNRYYHLDHRYSIVEGFKQNIPPYIIGSYHNLEIIPSRANIQKYSRCSITKEELFSEYFRQA